MKDLIRKILKESEDDLGWAQEIVNSVNNPTIIDRNESYIISVCHDPINPDEFRYKFEELYGEWNVDKLNMNVFKNKGNKVEVTVGIMPSLNSPPI